ncbi:MAG: helix-turn-helix domain-containing protein [Bacteroidetes bacterium]|nr:helix-turn-helix domain-containing protein [Bacteroidota bacterium]MCZ6900627.1 helix-turn-helix domain-containing protein [Bacteroidota bacterium]
MPKTALPDLPSYNYWELASHKKIHAVKYIVRTDDEARGLSVHRIDHYAIRWVVKGQGQILINNIPMELKPNLIFMGNPSQTTQYLIADDQEVEVYIIAFTQELIGLMNLEKEAITLIYDLSNRMEIYPNDYQKEALKSLFELTILEFNQGEGPLRERILASLVKAILQYLFRLKSHIKIDKKNQNYLIIYTKFLFLLDQHFREKHMVTDYSQEMFTTEKRLNRACKSLTNLSAGKVIQKRLDVEAKRLLYFRDDSVKEIGYQLGFKDAAHFNKFFKNLNGVSPGVFRKIL